LLEYLPVGVDRDACPDRSDQCGDTPSYADGHDNVKRYAHFSQSKDATVLEKDGYLGEHEAGVVEDDTPEQVLFAVSFGEYTNNKSSLLGWSLLHRGTQ
jgi:hypothetical protein